MYKLATEEMLHAASAESTGLIVLGVNLVGVEIFINLSVMLRMIRSPAAGSLSREAFRFCRSPAQQLRIIRREANRFYLPARTQLPVRRSVTLQLGTAHLVTDAIQFLRCLLTAVPLNSI